MTGPVFPADAVITFTAPKPAHVFGQLTRRWDQPIIVAPIGSPEGAIVSQLNLQWAGSALRFTQAPRPAAANKGNFGHVLVVGGSLGICRRKSRARRPWPLSRHCEPVQAWSRQRFPPRHCRW